jgi:hypothetical protein
MVRRIISALNRLRRSGTPETAAWGGSHGTEMDVSSSFQTNAEHRIVIPRHLLVKAAMQWVENRACAW